MKKLFLFLFIFFVFFISACGDNAGETDAPQSSTNEIKTSDSATQNAVSEVVLSREQVRDMHLTFTKAVQKEIARNVEAYGEIIALPTDQATINARVRGIVDKIFVHEGEDIRKGTAMFSISSPDIIDWQDQYLRAKGQLVYLSKELARQKLLQAENVSSAKNVEMAESDYFQANSLLHIAISKLQNAGVPISEKDTAWEIKKNVIIRAPMDGNVTQILVNIGASAVENMPLSKMVSMRNLHAHVQVYAQDAMRMQLGMRADLYINDATQALAGRIEYISKEINPVSKTVSLHIRILGTEAHHYFPGLPIRAEIYVEKVKAWTAPTSCLLYDGTHYSLFYKDRELGDKVYFRTLQLPNTFVNDTACSLPHDFDLQKPIVLKGGNFLDGEIHKSEMQE